MIATPGNQRRAITGRWWQQQWLKLLDGVDDRGRLQRGRSYARTGRVIRVYFYTGEIIGQVRGRGWWNYDVRLSMPVLPLDLWEQVVADMAAEVRYEAALLAGELPPDVDALVQRAGGSLLIDDLAALDPECSCDDYERPCKHIIAVILNAGDVIAQNPLILPILCGAPIESMLSTLRAARPAPVAAPAVVPADDASPSDFWQGAGPLPEIAAPSGQPAGVAVLRDVGLPSFISDRRTLSAVLEQAYRSMQQQAAKALD